jgi:hypothetical protein
VAAGERYEKAKRGADAKAAADVIVAHAKAKEGRDELDAMQTQVQYMSECMCLGGHSHISYAVISSVCRHVALIVPPRHAVPTHSHTHNFPSHTRTLAHSHTRNLPSHAADENIA